MAISDTTIAQTVSSYLGRFPDEAEALEEPLRLLDEGSRFASRRTFPMHVTVGALLVCGPDVLLIDHLAYGITLQPGGHLEPTDSTLLGAALRELTEETGLDERHIAALSPLPVYIEFGLVPARPDKDELEHYHLDIGYAFSTDRAEIGSIQETEVTGAAWYPVNVAVTVVGERVARAVGITA